MTTKPEPKVHTNSNEIKSNFTSPDNRKDVDEILTPEVLRKIVGKLRPHTDKSNLFVDDLRRFVSHYLSDKQYKKSMDSDWDERQAALKRIARLNFEARDALNTLDDKSRLLLLEALSKNDVDCYHDILDLEFLDELHEQLHVIMEKFSITNLNGLFDGDDNKEYVRVIGEGESC